MVGEMPSSMGSLPNGVRFRPLAMLPAMLEADRRQAGWSVASGASRSTWRQGLPSVDVAESLGFAYSEGNPFTSVRPI